MKLADAIGDGELMRFELTPSKTVIKFSRHWERAVLGIVGLFGVGICLWGFWGAVQQSANSDWPLGEKLILPSATFLMAVLVFVVFYFAFRKVKSRWDSMLNVPYHFALTPSGIEIPEYKQESLHIAWNNLRRYEMVTRYVTISGLTAGQQHLEFDYIDAMGQLQTKELTPKSASLGEMTKAKMIIERRAPQNCRFSGGII